MSSQSQNPNGTQPKIRPRRNRGSMTEQINNRKRFYGEVKSWPRMTMKVSPEVLRILNSYRGPKSWSRFMEDIAAMLDNGTTTRGAK